MSPKKMKKKMKVGDLVKWTHPEAEGFGIIIPLEEVYRNSPTIHNRVSIHWFDTPEHNALYEWEHPYLELVSESR